MSRQPRRRLRLPSVVTDPDAIPDEMPGDEPEGWDSWGNTLRVVAGSLLVVATVVVAILTLTASSESADDVEVLVKGVFWMVLAACLAVGVYIATAPDVGGRNK